MEKQYCFNFVLFLTLNYYCLQQLQNSLFSSILLNKGRESVSMFLV